MPKPAVMKYVLVTGGVVSGLGKGVTASSIGVLLQACGKRVTSIKIGTYFAFLYQNASPLPLVAQPQSASCTPTCFPASLGPLVTCAIKTTAPGRSVYCCHPATPAAAL